MTLFRHRAVDLPRPALTDLTIRCATAINLAAGLRWELPALKRSTSLCARALR